MARKKATSTVETQSYTSADVAEQANAEDVKTTDATAKNAGQGTGETSTDVPQSEDQTNTDENGEGEDFATEGDSSESDKPSEADAQQTEDQSTDAIVGTDSGDKSNEDAPKEEVQTDSVITGKIPEIADSLVVKVKNPTSVRAFEPLSMTEIGAYSEVKIVCKSVAQAQQVKANIQQLTKLGRKLEIMQ